MVGGKAVVVGVLGRKVGKKLGKVGSGIALAEGYNPRNTTG